MMRKLVLLMVLLVALDVVCAARAGDRYGTAIEGTKAIAEIANTHPTFSQKQRRWCDYHPT